MPRAITIDNLVLNYGSFRAIDGLSLSVPTGSVCALIGNNGAGKTTIVHALMGLLPLQAGRCAVLDIDPTKEPLKVRQMVGFFPERDQPYDWIRVQGIRGSHSCTHLAASMRSRDTWGIT